MRRAGRCGDRPLGEVKRRCCRRGEHRSSAKHSQRNRRTANGRPYGSDEVRRYDEPLSRLRRQLPLGRGAKGVAVFHGLAPMGESWRAAPERGYSPPFADQQPVTYVSPETMAAPTGATLPLPSQAQDFHLIRPVFALGTFPSRGRLENVFLFLVLWFLVQSTMKRYTA